MADRREDQQKYERIASLWQAAKKEPLSAAQLKALYEYEAAVWGYDTSTSRIFSLEPIHEAVLRMVRSSHARRLLDTGCGPNPTLDITLIKEGRSVIAIEYCLGYSNYAQRQANELGVPLVVINGDASQLPFSSDTFEGCICSETLEHVLEPAKALREIHRVLKPGGKLFLTVPNERNAYTFYLWLLRFLAPWKRALVAPEEHPSHLHHFSKQELRGMFSDFFAVEKHYWVGFSKRPLREQPVEHLLSKIIQFWFFKQFSASHAFVLRAEK